MNDRRMKPWIEWKERCAIALCSSTTQEALRSFGGMRFRTLAQRCLPLVNVKHVNAVMLPDSDAWHLLETHMTLPETPAGKTYKQWLFARLHGALDAPFDIIQGGATLIMRSVVRDYLRREFSPADHVAITMTACKNGTSSTISESTLPGNSDTLDTVATRELNAIAAREAERFFEQMALRSRLALAARYLRIPLSTPSVLALADCEKSVLYSTCKQSASELLEEIRNTYSSEDRATITDITFRTFEAVMNLCVNWALETTSYREALTAEAPRCSLAKERS